MAQTNQLQSLRNSYSSSFLIFEDPMYYLGILVFILAQILLATIIISHIKIYLQTQRTDIDSDTVWLITLKKMPSNIVLTFAMALLIIAGLFIFVIPGIYIAVALSFALTVKIIENKGVAESINRSLTLVKNNWMDTFILIVVIAIIQVVVSSIFTLPMQVYVATKTIITLQDGASTSSFDKLIFILLNIISMVVTTYLYTISYIAVTIQYFHLVEEKESVGLMNMVNNIGNKDIDSDN